MSGRYATGISVLGLAPETPDPVNPLVEAADLAPVVMGEWIGEAIALVLMDHSEDEAPDPNVHELARRVVMLGRLGRGELGGS
jgi:hypothetical protein